MADDATEPWTVDSPEYQEHKKTCFICANDGSPGNAAHRPHTLDSKCWCINNLRGQCYIAIDFKTDEWTKDD